MNDQALSLAQQLDELQSRIKRDAGSARLRIHLFQLLCVIGNWKRALGQLQLCAQLDAKALPMAQMYREAIKCELFREQVFAGKRTPQVLGTPPAWIGLLIEALRQDGSGNAAAAADLRTQAMQAADARACTVDGAVCDWLADGDARLGPVCEVFANGQYYWLPFESCRAIQIEAPTDLRDLVWSPAEVLLPNEGRIPALIPTRYPQTSESTADKADALKQSRLTEWIECAPDAWLGLGQRVWMSDRGEHPILQTRAITMGLASAEPAAGVMG
ncbi:MAG: type VI secretion system accessory protein TagJ [Rhodoferax sp.]